MIIDRPPYAHLRQNVDSSGPKLLGEDELLLALHVDILDRVGGHRDHLINWNQVLNVTLSDHDPIASCVRCDHDTDTDTRSPAGPRKQTPTPDTISEGDAARGSRNSFPWPSIIPAHDTEHAMFKSSIR